MLDMEFIERFLSSVEGPRQTRGYIPCHVSGGGTANYRGDGDPARFTAMGASGVTIATGCDLGQTDAATLAGYGLAADIIGRFSFYFGKRKASAITALHERQLVISEAEAMACDRAVHEGYLNRYTRPAFEKASGVAFDKQPPEAQAVIMSVCFQKGCGGVARDWPILWGHLCRRNWKAASRELLTGFSQYKSRRRLEGKLLERIA